MIQVDLHVHSEASSKGAGFFSSRLGIQESYLQPRQAYDILRERGMSLVTLTDHDSIDGCLQIAHLPGVFVSEEITARFPEDGCRIHVIALDIGIEQHQRIQQCRENVYELVEYLQSENIEHILAHPLYDMDGELSRWHIERCLLLFDSWELVNGTRSGLSSLLTGDIAEYFDGRGLDELARRHGFNWRRRRQIALTAGSDDHGGYDIGMTYTRAPGETLEDLKIALQRGTTSSCGQYGSPVRLSHMIMNISYQWGRTHGAEGALLEYLFGERRRGWLARLTGVDRMREFVQMVGGVDADSADRHREAHQFFRNFFPWVLRELSSQREFDMDRTSRLLGQAVLSAVPTMFYLSTYWQRAIEKKRSRRLHRSLLGMKKHRTSRVAYFTDTLHEVNGVALTSRKLLDLAAQQDLDMVFISCDRQAPVHADHQKVFEPLLSFPLPEYPEIRINIPQFLDMLEYVERENIEIIYAATPGVLGIYAYLIARILQLPYSCAFHTDFPGYVERYTGDHLFARNVWWVYAALCNSSAQVLCPSRAYARVLKRNGVRKKKIRLFARGVDTQVFSPEHRDLSFWESWGQAAHDRYVVLCVGRVAVEKSVDIFVQTAELMQERRDLVFVLVGDGPLLPEVRDRAPDNLICTGMLRGQDLSRAYASADLFMFPSETETFGNVVLEAQASGLPVLVSGKGASSENMREGVTGLSVDDRNPFEWRAALESVLDTPGRLSTWSTGARSYAGTRDARAELLAMLDMIGMGRLRKRSEAQSICRLPA